jgi:nickel transport protein
MSSTHLCLAAALAVVTAAAPARAHEILHEVVGGRAVAVRVFESDGDRVANAPYEVFAPGGATTAWFQGRTDRNGWLAFVPDVPGKWRLKVYGDEGHGLDVTIDAGAGASGGGGLSTFAFVLRPVIAVAAIALVFGVLLRVYRKQRAGSR